MLGHGCQPGGTCCDACRLGDGGVPLPEPNPSKILGVVGGLAVAAAVAIAVVASTKGSR